MNGEIVGDGDGVQGRDRGWQREEEEGRKERQRMGRME